VYGLLHAAGPGHRKTIVFSLFLARKARWWEPLATGFMSSLAHAAVGVTLVVVLSLISGAVAPLASMEGIRAWMEGLTFVILALVALLLSIRTLHRLATGRTHDHGHADESYADGRKLYAIAALASLVPCPGATMMLLFALYLDLPLLGIIGVLAMSFGMALVISAAGYLAWFGRGGLFLRLKARTRTVFLITGLLELGSYLFMLAFTVYAAAPFAVSLFRMIS
jgi:ABC-type nickel/cobalt efflux system permease component RcnA